MKAVYHMELGRISNPKWTKTIIMNEYIISSYE